ncbi:hypothetical protein ISG33_09805 [Glaciecola sp. MH2013]|nr:hypothetical protein [Glaciecola sp. MH2013]
MLFAFLPFTQILAKGDPTRPPGKVERFVESSISKDAAIVVSAVLKKNQVYYAVINQQWLKTGESYLGWRVTRITNSAVYLQNISEPSDKSVRFLVNENSDFKKQANDE